MKWAIIKAAKGKTERQRFDLLDSHVKNKFSSEKSGIARYANPVPHPTDGSFAIPILPEAEKHLADAPFAVTALFTTEELKELGWFPDLPTSNPLVVIPKKVITPHEIVEQSVWNALDAEFWLYAGAAACAGAFFGLAHYVWHWF